MTTDFDAFMALYDATCDDAYRLALCRTRNRAVAEDILVTAYVRAFRKRGDLASYPYSARAWMLSLVRHELSGRRVTKRTSARFARAAS